jgi:HEAT repeat protein
MTAVSNKVIIERNNHLRRGSVAEEIAALIAKLGDKDGLIRETARLSIIDFGQSAVPSLVKLLGDKREQVRWEAVNALSEIADASAARALVKCLEDKVFEVRWLAAEALIKIGVEGLIPALRAILLNPEPDWLWEGVRHIVHDLAKGDLESPLAPLKAAFDDVDYRMKVPLEARKALDRLGLLPEEI